MSSPTDTLWLRGAPVWLCCVDTSSHLVTANLETRIAVEVCQTSRMDVCHRHSTALRRHGERARQQKGCWCRKNRKEGIYFVWWKIKSWCSKNKVPKRYFLSFSKYYFPGECPLCERGGYISSILHITMLAKLFQLIYSRVTIFHQFSFHTIVNEIISWMLILKSLDPHPHDCENVIGDSAGAIFHQQFLHQYQYQLSSRVLISWV